MNTNIRPGDWIKRRRLRGIFLTAPAMGLVLWTTAAILLWLAVRGLG